MMTLYESGIWTKLKVNSSVYTELFAASFDLAGTSASNETVRLMHDDSAALSKRCDLPANEI